MATFATTECRSALLPTPAFVTNGRSTMATRSVAGTIASPAPSPLLVTPTPGHTETRAAEPPVVKLTATPTAGQRITEGREGKVK